MAATSSTILLTSNIEGSTPRQSFQALLDIGLTTEDIFLMHEALPQLEKLFDDSNAIHQILIRDHVAQNSSLKMLCQTSSSKLAQSVHNSSLHSETKTAHPSAEIKMSPIEGLLNAVRGEFKSYQHDPELFYVPHTEFMEKAQGFSPSEQPTLYARYYGILQEFKHILGLPFYISLREALRVKWPEMPSHEAGEVSSFQPGIISPANIFSSTTSTPHMMAPSSAPATRPASTNHSSVTTERSSSRDDEKTIKSKKKAINLADMQKINISFGDLFDLFFSTRYVKSLYRTILLDAFFFNVKNPPLRAAIRKYSSAFQAGVKDVNSLVEEIRKQAQSSKLQLTLAKALDCLTLYMDKTDETLVAGISAHILFWDTFIIPHPKLNEPLRELRNDLIEDFNYCVSSTPITLPLNEHHRAIVLKALATSLYVDTCVSPALPETKSFASPLPTSNSSFATTSSTSSSLNQANTQQTLHESKCSSLHADSSSSLTTTSLISSSLNSPANTEQTSHETKPLPLNNSINTQQTLQATTSVSSSAPSPSVARTRSTTNWGLGLLRYQGQAAHLGNTSGEQVRKGAKKS